jgi:hypothetical protein
MSDQPPDDNGGTPDPARRRRNDPADMPFYEGEKIGDETPRYRRWGPVVLTVLVVALVAAAFVLLSGGDDEEPAATTPPPATTTTTTSTTTTTVATTTTVPGPLEAGDLCDPDEDGPDCVDLDGDGNFVYVPGAAECLQTATDPRDCQDNDGDGVAGPPVASS